MLKHVGDVHYSTMDVETGLPGEGRNGIVTTETTAQSCEVHF